MKEDENFILGVCFMLKKEEKKGLTKKQLERRMKEGFRANDECLVCRQGVLVKRDNEVLVFIRKGVVVMPGVRPEEILPLECSSCGTGFKEKVLSCYVGQKCPTCNTVSAVVVKGGKRKPLPLGDGMVSLTSVKKEALPPLECTSCNTRYQKARESLLRRLRNILG